MRGVWRLTRSEHAHRLALPRLEERSDERNEKDDKENEKQYPRHTGGGGGHAAKSEYARGQHEDGEDKRPNPQHLNSSSLGMNRAAAPPLLNPSKRPFPQYCCNAERRDAFLP